jgi:hypothetical protein
MQRTCRRRRVHWSARTASLVLALLALGAISVPSRAAEQPAAAQVALRIGSGPQAGGKVPAHFVGLSIEWSLVERYMGPNARPAFANLLKNLGTGLLRIGGSSEDAMPFDATGPNTNRNITPQDLDYIRATLDAANSVHGGRIPAGTPSWGVVLGTAMSPPSAAKPFDNPANAHSFVTQGIEPAFPGKAAKDVAGIELGNEPDLSYGSNLTGYLDDLATFSAPDVTGPFPVIAPNTSEDILPWESVAGGATRWFWNWPQILDADAATVKARAGAFGAYATDHFYPLARTCVDKPYRCASTTALLSDEHMQSLDYQAYTHATEAAKYGLGYRIEETNTAADRGADGVSNVAASATWALDMMFHAACPQPPNQPGANATCGVGATGVNFHNAEVNAIFEPQEGNAYYNAIDYDPSDAMGAPTAAPLYYAMLVFGRLAQNTSGLRPLTLDGGAAAAGVDAWQVTTHQGELRAFLINKSDQPVTVSLDIPGSHAFVDRMTPYDPTGSGKTLDASQVRVDGRQVAANGTWPGFRPTLQPIANHRMTVTLAPGEASVITVPQLSRR